MITMGVIITYLWKGEEMASLTDNGTEVFVNISIGKAYNDHHMSKASVLMVSVLSIAVFVCSMLWVIYYHISRFINMDAKTHLTKKVSSAAKKAISKIPTKTLEKEYRNTGECCPICIELYKVSDTIRVLPCNHEFHRSCIDPWLIERRTCPMCKIDVLRVYGFVFTGSQESILSSDAEGFIAEEYVPDNRSEHSVTLHNEQETDRNRSSEEIRCQPSPSSSNYSYSLANPNHDCAQCESTQNGDNDSIHGPMNLGEL